MAQQRFFNWKEADSTFLLSQRLTGIQPKGRYAGYDFTPTADLNLTLAHSVTGAETRDFAGVVKSIGVAMTNQGVIVFEDGNIVLPVSATTTEPRIDVVVLTHSQTQTPGGAAALYSVVQGTPSATPVKPSLPTPATQIEIGSLYLPANTNSLTDSGVVWTQSKVSAFETKLDIDVFTQSLTALNNLDSNVIEALGRSFAFQNTSSPTGLEPALPPILLCGGTNEAFNVVGGFIYYQGELLILEDGYNFDSGSGDVVFDIIGTAPFRVARPRISAIPDGDFSKSNLKLPYNYLIESINGGAWVNLTPINGWETDVPQTAGFNKLQVRRVGTRVELRGCVRIDGGALPSSGVLYQIGASLRPLKENRFSIRHTTGIGDTGFPEQFYSSEVYVKANGDIEIKSPISNTTSFYWLDGVHWFTD